MIHDFLRWITSVHIIHQFEEAWKILQKGKIIAYPTEAVYGLGCDPFNQQAVEKLLTLKQRPASKGLIILISHWPQLMPLISPLSDELLAKVRHTWPGPVTWLFPKSPLIPSWLSGSHNTIAIRMSAHPIAQQISAQNPVVSTSANVSGCVPARDVQTLMLQFPQGIEAVLAGELGGANQPSAIYDVCDGGRCR